MNMFDSPRVCCACVDPAGQLPGPDRGSDEGKDHRGGQERAGGQRRRRGGPGEDPATQSMSRQHSFSNNGLLIFIFKKENRGNEYFDLDSVF